MSLSFGNFLPIFYDNQHLILRHLKNAPTLGDHSLFSNEYRVHITIDTLTTLTFSVSSENNGNEILTTIQLNHITVKILYKYNIIPRELTAMPSDNSIYIPLLQLFIHAILKTQENLPNMSVGTHYFVNIDNNPNWDQLMPESLIEPTRIRWTDDQIKVASAGSNNVFIVPL